jgi:hypothetical protein
MRIYNGTPHEINIIDRNYVSYDRNIRKYCINEDVFDIESVTLYSFPSNGLLNAVFASNDKKDKSIGNLPIKIKTLVSVDPIPIGFDIIIVSGLYQSAIGYNDNVYTVIDPVFSFDGKTVVGCLAIGKVEF